MTSVHMNPYLQFQDHAREAMDFYRQVFGGELTMHTFAEGGMVGHPSYDDRIMHAQLETPQGLVLVTPAPWGDVFGACVDRFGTSWMVNITGTAG
jgi:PhnB protein